jgi:hypothetical protein
MVQRVADYGKQEAARLLLCMFVSVPNGCLGRHDGINDRSEQTLGLLIKA